MADYWKSQPRKFCELCKCWMADNKPSRDFHERGKRHQESVKRKLDELKKKGVQDAKKERECNKYLMQMERGAMKKYEQDILNDPTLAARYEEKLKQIAKEEEEQEQEKSQISQFILDKLKTKNLPIPVQTEEISEEKLIEQLKQQQQSSSSSKYSDDWQEAFSEEGHVYYWNTKTHESSWYLPGSDEYKAYMQHITMLQQHHHPIPTTTTTTSTASLAAAAANDDNDGEDGDDDDDGGADDNDVGSASSTSSSKDAKRNTSCSSATTSLIKISYKNHSSIYGAWKEVKKTEPADTPSVDLQLPASRANEYKTIVVPSLTKEPKLTIRERTLATVNSKTKSSAEPVVFKKRRFNNIVKVKVENDDDDDRYNNNNNNNNNGDDDGDVRPAKMRNIRRARNDDDD
ncbi:hypothetical protein HELRODRAFT_191166 [Helobdella robusta]|uniref:WW domain-containing protein n=1 Tax=Helobdella robusta TaxID=6412 RepID=T1FSP3_HELRO|nr:hypothetical protein HELRODRAFT_191166 [Helobdella robusta]ESO07393.1 hypothetical protein HELRODRAFT_191166 [Helobdella robusta]